MNNKRSDKKNSFSNVDSSDDPLQFVKCMDDQYEHNSILRTNKARTLALADIQPGMIVLDAGCGTGVDVATMAQLVGASGHVYGVDFSEAMIASARQRIDLNNSPVTFQQASIYQLPFEDNFFDRVRADKVFQHLAEPEMALGELFRVTKPGGKIITADPDHDSLIIDTPFTEVNEAFVRFRSRHMAQGGIAHQMYRLLKSLGMSDVFVEPRTSAYTDYNEKKVSSPYLEEIWMANEYGIVSRDAAQTWVDYLEAAIESGQFLCLQTYIITTGTKPVL